MRYQTIKQYLENGNFEIITSEDEYKLNKKENKTSTTFKYKCHNNHESSITIASFKNKKSKFKNNYEGFCSTCKLEQVLNTSSDLSDDTLDDTRSKYEEEVEQKMPAEVSLEYNNDIETIQSDNDLDSVDFDANIKKYKLYDEEFYTYFCNKYDILHASWRLIGNNAFERSEYINKAISWIKTTKNICTKETYDECDIFINGLDLHVSKANTIVVVHSIFIHNIDPKLWTKIIKEHTLHNDVVVVLVFNCDFIYDTWYFIKNKKPYSIRNKGLVIMENKIDSFIDKDQNEWLLYEQRMFEICINLI